jgi:hypothetical protein
VARRERKNRGQTGVVEAGKDTPQESIPHGACKKIVAREKHRAWEVSALPNAGQGNMMRGRNKMGHGKDACEAPKRYISRARSTGT